MASEIDAVAKAVEEASKATIKIVDAFTGFAVLLAGICPRPASNRRHSCQRSGALQSISPARVANKIRTDSRVLQWHAHRDVAATG